MLEYEETRIPGPPRRIQTTSGGCIPEWVQEWAPPLFLCKSNGFRGVKRSGDPVFYPCNQLTCSDTSLPDAPAVLLHSNQP